MERIVGWIDGLVADGLLPGVSDKATKLQARTRRESRVSVGAFCVKTAKQQVRPNVVDIGYTCLFVM